MPGTISNTNHQQDEPSARRTIDKTNEAAVSQQPVNENPTIDQRKIPGPALWLGLAGLIPFFATAATLWLGGTINQFDITAALVAYAAVILSFLGGINWGAAIVGNGTSQLTKPLFWSIVPSLAAWAALLLQSLFSEAVALFILLVAFVLQYLSDRRAVALGLLPPWFARLRLILTCGAVLSLAIGLVGVIYN